MLFKRKAHTYIIFTGEMEIKTFLMFTFANSFKLHISYIQRRVLKTGYRAVCAKYRGKHSLMFYSLFGRMPDRHRL